MTINHPTLFHGAASRRAPSPTPATGFPDCLRHGVDNHLFDGLRYLWRTASAGKRQWLRSRWDQLSYDHRWLTEPGSETAPGVTSEQKLD
jgi:hypothetical protein